MNKFTSYPYTSVLGWSYSRYALFDECLRKYYYQYYTKFYVGSDKSLVFTLKKLSNVALTYGTLVHEVMETVLRRLQMSDDAIDMSKFENYMNTKVHEYFALHELEETYYLGIPAIESEALIRAKLFEAFEFFFRSALYQQLEGQSVNLRKHWIIEPPGYGELRIDGWKAFAKLDFGMFLGSDFQIYDWKTGNPASSIHTMQMLAYTYWVHQTLEVPVDRIKATLIYTSNWEPSSIFHFSSDDLEIFRKVVIEQTTEMYNKLRVISKNIPLDIIEFPMTEDLQKCTNCVFREICNR